MKSRPNRNLVPIAVPCNKYECQCPVCFSCILAPSTRISLYCCLFSLVQNQFNLDWGSVAYKHGAEKGMVSDSIRPSFDLLVYSAMTNPHDQHGDGHGHEHHEGDGHDHSHDEHGHAVHGQKHVGHLAAHPGGHHEEHHDEHHEHHDEHKH
uniref:Histidine-rich glycoprotein-like n=1 Tax=Panagrellus redivivus TaxID=6233 RepID=A0A7E4VT32_PANRE